MTEVVGWLGIVASPLLASAILGGIIYLNTPDTIGIILGCLVVAIGLIVGIILATRIWKKTGTVHFLSRVSATPDIDQILENSDNKKQPPHESDSTHR